MTTGKRQPDPLTQGSIQNGLPIVDLDHITGRFDPDFITHNALLKRPRPCNP